MTTWRAAGLVVVGLLGAVATSAAAADDAPVAVVETLDAGLLGLLKDAERLGYQGRVDRIRPIVEQVFDLDFMAEKAIGKYWDTLAESDRARWKPLFHDFTIANYAGNFDHFSGQRFEVLGSEAGANDTTMVRTKLFNPAGEDVELTYRLHRVGQGWRIIDILLKGTVSELALRRSDYTSVLERDGFAALVTLLRGKIADLAAGRGKRTAP